MRWPALLLTFLLYGACPDCGTVVADDLYEDDAWSRHAQAMELLHVPRPTTITAMGASYGEELMTRRELMKRLGMVPLGVAAAGLGIEASEPVRGEGLAQLMMKAYQGLGRQVGKSKQVIYAHPTLIDAIKRTDPDGDIAAIADRLVETHPILMQEPTGRIRIKTGLPRVSWRPLDKGGS